ncbi:protein CROWDED NUCLEI 2-like [Helianthus annuus]|uniref:protein CROWDED NUCLEI 2-like n=1 Tax=Helianthus annuus TaxID=4232 RepID=UPI000B8EED71|nr:protein CROWDED NUCLEI 2-like [Helianthus annuus]
MVMIMLKSLGLKQLHLHHHNHHHKINPFLKLLNPQDQRIKIFLIYLEIFLMLLVKELQKKVGELEKEKPKAEAERDMLKKQVEELSKVNEEIKTVMIKQQEKLKKLEDGVHDNSQLFEILSAENVEMRQKMKNLHDINQTLNQLLSEINEASSNEMKAMKLEMEAMKADKVVKDEQLNMLYTVMESHRNIDVHAAFNNIEVKRAEECRIERERELAQEATQRRKGLVVDTEETLGSSSQPEAGGSSSQVDVEMVDAEVDPKGFVLVEGDDDDDNDQGSSGLLIVNPSVQQKIEDFLNDEINEQEDDQHQEASTSGKQHVDQFDIEDEIPPSPEREYEFKYSQEADKYDEVIVEEASDSSDEETDFHYSGIDETFLSLAEMFKYQKEDEIRRKIVEKITTEGVPKTIPRENLSEERKKWFKVMPKERKYIRPLQYYTHDANVTTLTIPDIRMN